jgi:hypothetical protein
MAVQNRLLSGVITVTTAGTAVQGTDVGSWEGEKGGFFIVGEPSNTGVVYVGNDGAGDVTSGNGFPLSPGQIIYVIASNLSELWFDAATSADELRWLKG